MTTWRRVGGVLEAQTVRDGLGVERILGGNTGPEDPTYEGVVTPIDGHAPLGAGGWVTGHAFSPDGNTHFCRTDTYGGYYWDTAADVWRQVITAASMPDDTYGDTAEGINAIAVSDTLAYMGYQGAIYRTAAPITSSSTWTKVLNSGSGGDPNDSYRYMGPRMVFDPSDDDVAIYGTQNNGLWYTLNGGTTWTQIPSGTLPFGTAAKGIICVGIDHAGNWYACPHGQGVRRSTNQGGSWTKISSDAQVFTARNLRIAANDDVLVVATASGVAEGSTTLTRVWRYRSGTWANVSPASARAWHTLAIDPTTAGRVAVHGEGGYQNVSPDNGDTWTSYVMSLESDDDVPWHAWTLGYGAVNAFGFPLVYFTSGELTFDPDTPGRLWLSQGVGVWYCDIAGASFDWHGQSRGIEQLITTDVIAPPGGPVLTLNLDRAVVIPEETTAVPTASIATVPDTPIGTPAALLATLTGGFPRAITYEWTIISAPVGSTADFADDGALSTTLTPDVLGDYAVRLVMENTTGTSFVEHTFTAIAAVNKLVLPGTRTNYVSTPHAAALHLPSGFEARAKVSLIDWSPSVAISIMSKWNTNVAKSWLFQVGPNGLRLSLSNTVFGSTGAFNVASLDPLSHLPPNSVWWISAVWDATAESIVFRLSADGVAWTVLRTVTDQSVDQVTSLYNASTIPLEIGRDSGATVDTNVLTGTVYAAQLYDHTGALVADFDAEAVTRLGTRNPTTYSDGTQTFTVNGTAWDWA